MKILGGILLLFAVHAGNAQDSPHGPMTIPCQSCHGTESWAMRRDAGFKHESTGFALGGRHESIRCGSCHRDLKFTKISRECSSCHTEVHRVELGTNCLRCHSTQSWQVQDMIQRHGQTRFPLVGRHQTVECRSCHERASEHQYLGTPVTCLGCHRQDYEMAASPNHKSSNFSTDCTRCHAITSVSWTGGFDHAVTSFPLTGAHRATPCSNCHQGNLFGGLSTDCVSCHRNDYNQTTSPNHVASGFPTACATCHSTAAWQGASFDHNITRFALTGAHSTTPCQSCHAGGNYQLVFSDCYQCHETQYQHPVNPNHVAANFSHDCRPCHTTTAWRPSTFNHDQQYFRIYSGKHRDKWTACSDCHQTQSNYTVFSCLNCHEHRQSEMDSKHQGVNGYSYSSPACYNCHRGV